MSQPPRRARARARCSPRLRCRSAWRARTAALRRRSRRRTCKDAWQRRSWRSICKLSSRHALWLALLLRRRRCGRLRLLFRRRCLELDPGGVLRLCRLLVPAVRRQHKRLHRAHHDHRQRRQNERLSRSKRLLRLHNHRPLHEAPRPPLATTAQRANAPCPRSPQLARQARPTHRSSDSSPGSRSIFST